MHAYGASFNTFTNFSDGVMLHSKLGQIKMTKYPIFQLLYVNCSR